VSDYTIEPSKHGTGFDISIINQNGSRQTILGFETIEDAEAWIAQDKEISAYDHMATRKEIN
jgi:hypothetical protein